VDYGDVISIKDGRHPVVEKFTRGGLFVPNDTLLDCEKNAFMTITGPNMSGKSTYMRQVAIITLMAQIGSFVPASSARIGITDRIFTRVGASDDLASGTSTFMLEMNEVAFILKNASRRSLIIYDEIGRGTSTFDGMAIARSVAEYTRKKLGCRTMFATHYHELISLSDELDGVVNYNIAAKKKGDDVIFLRKIVPGGTDDSFGIEVAKLAGIPADLVRRAREILRQLESGTYEIKHKLTQEQAANNMTIDDMKAAAIRDRLLKTNINTLTPVEALNLLSELCEDAR
jgi:DNA mismatch repair protein MutS